MDLSISYIMGGIVGVLILVIIILKVMGKGGRK